MTVCALTPGSTLTLPATSNAPRLARHFLDGVLCDVHLSAVRDDAALLVSELVTNAVRYGLPPVQITVECAISQMMVSISDTASDTGISGPEASPDDAESGRGLRLVDVISDAWGIDPQPRGKAVWFRLGPL